VRPLLLAASGAILILLATLALATDRVWAFLVALGGVGGGFLLWSQALRELRIRRSSDRLVRHLHVLPEEAGPLDPVAGDPLDGLAAAVNAATLRIRRTLDGARQEARQLRAVLDAMADGVFLFDQDLHLTLANRAAQHLFGFRLEAVLGSTPIRVFRRHELDTLLRRVREQGAGGHLEMEQTRPDRRVFRVAADPVGPEGTILVVVRDLTEVRRAEAVRRDFVANVSHELRTPLASVRAMAEALLDGGLEDPLLAQRFLGQIVQEVDRLSRLTQDLLDFSALESGAVQLRMEPLRAAEILEEVARRFGPVAERKGIRLEVEGDGAVFGDRDRLVQALGNLVDNALKFTPPGGEVRVAAEEAVETVVLAVEDTGPGIPPHHLPRVFERFYRVDPSRARQSGGAGLGLAITKHIALGHGGRVEAANRPGGGCRFTIALRKPTRSPNADGGATVAHTAPPGDHTAQ